MGDIRKSKKQLKIYLTPEKTPLEKAQNRQTLELAKTIFFRLII
jgi:hypothetical protein